MLLDGTPVCPCWAHPEGVFKQTLTAGLAWRSGWLRILLPVTQVQSLAQEDALAVRAAQPAHDSC